MRCLFFFWLFFCGCHLLVADEIVLKNGKSLFGEIHQEGEHLVLVDLRGESLILTDEVAIVKDRMRLKEEYQTFSQDGELSHHYKLGMWCWVRGLKEEACFHFLKVIAEEPENRFARWGLGYIKVKGIWIKAGEWTLLPNKKNTWVRWVPKGVKGKVNVYVGKKPSLDSYLLLRKICFGTAHEKEMAFASFNKLSKEKRQKGLLLGLFDNSPQIRSYSIEKLAKEKGKAIAKGLAKKALRDSRSAVRELALKSLTQGDFPTANGFLLTGLTSKYFSVRLNAIRALEYFPSSETVNALATVMESDSPSIPRSNIFVGTQISYIKDFDVEIAQDATIADPIVGTISEGAALETRSLRIDIIRRVQIQRGAAYQTLQKIAGKDLGTKSAAWREWAKGQYVKE